MLGDIDLERMRRADQFHDRGEAYDPPQPPWPEYELPLGAAIAAAFDVIAHPIALVLLCLILWRVW